MITKKTYFIPLFFSVLLLLSLTTPVFAAADEYGNQIVNVKFIQEILGSSETQDWIFAVDYVENMTVELQRRFDIYITANAWVNITEADPSIPDYMALAIQFLYDGGYEGPMALATPDTDPPEGFISVGYSVPDWVNNPNESFMLNVTRWHDYEKNGTWTLAEDWLFFCDVADAPEYEPEVYGSLELGFVWFWLFVGGIFFTAISAGAAIKKISLKYGIVALLAGTFTYAFFMIIAAGG